VAGLTGKLERREARLVETLHQSTGCKRLSFEVHNHRLAVQLLQEVDKLVRKRALRVLVPSKALLDNLVTLRVLAKVVLNARLAERELSDSLLLRDRKVHHQRVLL